MEGAKLNLQRPLIFFDLETTGTSITNDRIVELSYMKVYPDAKIESKTYRVNPGMKIPEGAIAVHHITNEDVANEPKFSEIAQEIFNVFEDSDVAGFNSNRFDVPLLVEEFRRVNIFFDVKNRHFIDVQTIYHKKEPRTLSAAYRHYCNAEIENAHSALADTEATYKVLLKQLEMYDDLENDVAFLAKFSSYDKKNNVDVAGHLRYNDQNEPVFAFGKYRGQKVKDVLMRDTGYYNWLMNADFPQDTKDKITAIKLTSKR